MSVRVQTKKKLVAPKNPRKNALFRAAILERAAKDPAIQAALWKRCAEDIVFYVDTFVFTENPRIKTVRIPFICYPFQERALREIVAAVHDSQDNIRADIGIKKSRDMGASWLNLIVVEWFWHFHPSSKMLLVSRNETYVDGNSKSLFAKIDFIHEWQPDWLLDKKLRGQGRTKMLLRNLQNGSEIAGESTTGEVARGDRRLIILLDEFASFEQQDGENALMATQAATNCRIFNSTPKGSANAFAKIFNLPTTRVISMHWSDHPVKNKGLYTSKKNESTGKFELELLDDWKGVVPIFVTGEGGKARKVAYPEDYPFILDGKIRSPWYDNECKASLSQMAIAQELDIDFAGSDYQFFDSSALSVYKAKWCKEPYSVGDLEETALGGLRFTENIKGHFVIFDDKLFVDGKIDPKRKFVLGGDISAGTGASNTTLVFYDRITREKVAEYVNPNILPDDFARLVVKVARLFNNALLAFDRSGPTGEVFYNRIIAERRNEDANISVYRPRDTQKLGIPTSDKEGVFLNSKLKTIVMTGYRDSLGHGRIINCSERALDECLCFIVRMDGTIEHSAAANATDPSGARANHGDIVIADALACLAMEDWLESETKEDEKAIPENTIAFRFEEARKKKLKDSDESLGEDWEP